MVKVMMMVRRSIRRVGRQDLISWKKRNDAMGLISQGSFYYMFAMIVLTPSLNGLRGAFEKKVEKVKGGEGSSQKIEKSPKFKI